MNEYKFGDVIRVDPWRNFAVAQPDDRRWMIVLHDLNRNIYRTIYMGGADWSDSAALGQLTNWSAKMLADGFIRCEDPE